jgi:DNA repair exonuclease SbcCD ATPase subunit
MFFSKQIDKDYIERVKQKQRIKDSQLYDEQLLKIENEHFRTYEKLKKEYNEKLAFYKKSKIQQYESTISLKNEEIRNLKNIIKEKNSLIKNYENGYQNYKDLQKYLTYIISKLEPYVMLINSTNQEFYRNLVILNGSIYQSGSINQVLLNTSGDFTGGELSVMYEF